MVPSVKDDNLSGTQKTVSLDFKEKALKAARESAKFNRLSLP